MVRIVAVFCLIFLGFTPAMPASESVRITGRVFLEGTNEPLAGAEIHLICGQTAYAYITNSPIQFATAQADGMFEHTVKLDPGGEFFFVVKSKEAPMWVSPMFYYDTKTTMFDLTVPQSGHWVVIRTTDEQGAAVAKQFFGLKADRNFTRTYGGFPIHHFTADENGEFILGPLTPGKYWVFMGTRDFAAPEQTLDLSEPPRGPDNLVVLDFRVQKIRRLTIRPVFTGLEKPSQYHASFASMTSPKSRQGMSQWITNIHDLYVQDSPPGDALVAIKAGREAVIHRVTVQGMPDEVIEVPFDFGLDPAASGALKLAFVEKDGRPASRVKVRLRLEEAASKPGVSLDLDFDAETGADGLADFGRVPAGEYAIEYQLKRQPIHDRSRRIRVPPDGTAFLKIEMQPEDVFTPVTAGGRVIDPLGEPLAGVGVSVEAEGKMMDPDFPDTKTNHNGEWQITGIKPKRHGGHWILYHHPLHPGLVEMDVPPDQLLNRQVVVGKKVAVRVRIILKAKPGKRPGEPGDRQVSLDELRERFAPEAVGCYLAMNLSGNLSRLKSSVDPDTGDVMFHEPPRGVRLFPHVSGPFWSVPALWNVNGAFASAGGFVIPPDFEGEVLAVKPIYEAVTRDAHLQFLDSATGAPVAEVKCLGQKSDASGRLRIQLLETADMEGVEGLFNQVRPPHDPLNLVGRGQLADVNDRYSVISTSAGQVLKESDGRTRIFFTRTDFESNSPEHPVKVLLQARKSE